MDQQEANQLTFAGGVLILEQLPVGSEFGFDCVVHQVGGKFKGIKMIPPGLHFVYFSIRSSEGQLSPRSGFFAQFEAQQCLIKVFDPSTEELDDRLISREMTNKYQFANLPYFDQNLAPYSLDKYRDWLRLSNYIDATLLKDVQPLNGLIDCVSHQLPQKFISNRQDGQQMDITQSEDPERCIRFTPIPNRFSHPDNCSSSDLSEHSRDSSFTLQSLIQNRSENFVLGELQFAFVTFLFCHVYESFEQWKRLLRLFCHCRRLPKQNPQLFVKLISTLHFQMQHVQPDLFVDIVDSENFLYQTLREFFENLASAEVGELNEQLLQRADRFKNHLKESMDWDLETELEDEAPVIVE